MKAKRGSTRRLSAADFGLIAFRGQMFARPDHDAHELALRLSRDRTRARRRAVEDARLHFRSRGNVILA